MRYTASVRAPWNNKVPVMTGTMNPAKVPVFSSREWLFFRPFRSQIFG
jgi:hypothetical protein